MLLSIADLFVDYQDRDVHPKVRLFCVDESGTTPVSLRFSVVSRTPSRLEAEYTSGMFSFARDGASELAVWVSDNRLAQLRLGSSYEAYVIKSDNAGSSVGLNLFSIAFLPTLCRNKGLLFHASLVEFDGWAIAFSASSGVGKSTQADLWVSSLGARCINGDKACLRYAKEGWRAYGFPIAGSSPYVCNEKAPLKTLVILRQATDNQIRRLDREEAAALISTHVYYPFWDEEATAASLETLDALVREIPIFLLECRPDEEAVRITRDAIFGKHS